MSARGSVWDLLGARVRSDGARPLVTYLNSDTGERMELSAASLANAVAKTAGLLRDELDTQPGDVVAVHLPLHWQTAVWWGACAAVGAVCTPGSANAPVGVATSDHLDSIRDCTEQIAVSLAPFGLPDGADIPAGVIEAAVAARTHPDVFTPWHQPDSDAPLLACAHEVLSDAQCVDTAAALAKDWGLTTGGRLLVTDAQWVGSPGDHTVQSDALGPDALRSDALRRCVESWLSLLAVPLVADASVVLVSHAVDSDTTAALMADERISARALTAWG